MASILPLAKSADEGAMFASKILACLRRGSQARRGHTLLLRRESMRPEVQVSTTAPNEAENDGSSWMLEWWNREAYLSLDIPLPINVSYFMLLERPSATSMSRRAGRISALMLAYRAALLMESVPPSSARAIQLPAGPAPGLRSRARSVPLCMRPFRHLFHTTRVPCLGRCGASQDSVHLGWGEHAAAWTRSGLAFENPSTCSPEAVASAWGDMPPVEVLVLHHGRMVAVRVPSHVLQDAVAVARSWFSPIRTAKIRTIDQKDSPPGSGSRLQGDAGARLQSASAWLGQAFEHAREQMMALPQPGGDGSPGLGVLTGGRRKAWAAAWPAFVRYVGDDRAKSIVGAAFAVCLDDRELPESKCRSTLGRALLHGDPTIEPIRSHDRWYDSRLQVVAFASGDVGVVAEHSTTDGAPVAEMLHTITQAERDVLWDDAGRDAVSANSPANSVARLAPLSGSSPAACILPILPPVHPRGAVPLSVDEGSASSTRLELARDLHDAVVIAEREHRDAARQHCTAEIRVQTGARALKAVHCSPDAFAQLAIALAWCIAHEDAGCGTRVVTRQGGGFAPVHAPGIANGTEYDDEITPWLVAQYEPAQTRRFAGGRTACIRATSAELCEAVSACMQLRRQGQGTGNSDLSRRAAVLVRQAMHRHSVLSTEAAAGHDVDRHLFGLQLALREAGPVAAATAAGGTSAAQDLDQLLQDTLVRRSARWRISTSNLTLPGVSLWGWGEVVPDGIGVAYSVHRDRLHFHVCSQTRPGIGESAAAIASLYRGTAVSSADGHAEHGDSLAEAVGSALPTAVGLLMALLQSRSTAKL